MHVQYAYVTCLARRPRCHFPISFVVGEKIIDHSALRYLPLPPIRAFVTAVHIRVHPLSSLLPKSLSHGGVHGKSANIMHDSNPEGRYDHAGPRRPDYDIRPALAQTGSKKRGREHERGLRPGGVSNRRMQCPGGGAWEVLVRTKLAGRLGGSACLYLRAATASCGGTPNKVAAHDDRNFGSPTNTNCLELKADGWLLNQCMAQGARKLKRWRRKGKKVMRRKICPPGDSDKFW